MKYYRTLLLSSVLVVCLAAVALAQPANAPEMHLLQDMVSSKPSALTEIVAKISATIAKGDTAASVEISLTLFNAGSSEVQIADPGESLFLHFQGCHYEDIDIPGKPMHDSPVAGFYPAPIKFRQMLRGQRITESKEHVIAIPAKSGVELKFSSEKIVMERIRTAFSSAPAGVSPCVKIEASLALINLSSSRGGRALTSDSILIAIPSE
jgi:hypothetical protein